MTHSTSPIIDDELLSAYLDGQLAPAERNRLEAALADNPEPHAALAQLRYTKTLLAEAPRMAVPRAFTLNEAMLGQTQQRRGWASWFQPAALRGLAALAGMLLLVVLIGDVGMRSHWFATQSIATRAELGGLAVDQGDPTAIIAKASPETAILAPTFLGLPQGVLLAVELGLAALAVALLLLARQMSRAP